VRINILNENLGKSAGKLLEEVSITFEKKRQRRHEFWILSCYVDFDLVEKYVDILLKTIRLTDVYLAFNFSEIYKLGPLDTAKKLRGIKKKLNKKSVNLEWATLMSSKLVHGKGYALIQRSKDVISDGAVLVTSANFTAPGFEGENVEIGYISNKKQDILNFQITYHKLWKNLKVDVTHAAFKQKKYLLKFGILSSGFFLHKWSGNLKQNIGIKYTLTELAKRKGTIAPELAEVGFDTGDTFTRQVLQLGNLPMKEIQPSFMMRFTIETYWGRWCPADAWNTLSESCEGAKEFIEEFQKATEDCNLSMIKESALEVQTNLINKSLIKPVDPDHLDRWMSRMQEIRVNQRRLERFFIGYEAHPLPYTIEQNSEVNNLFDSMQESIESSKTLNIAKRKFLAASNESNPDIISLTDGEKKLVIAERRG